MTQNIASVDATTKGVLAQFNETDLQHIKRLLSLAMDWEAVAYAFQIGKIAGVNETITAVGE